MKRSGMHKKKQKVGIDEDGKRNLLGVFEILLKVDRRINPEFYKSRVRLNKGRIINQ